MLIGYVRVSTNDQNTDLQRNALVCAGYEQIFEDKLSGTRTGRPGLKRALKRLQKGGNDSNLLIVFYVQIMPDDFVMQLHRF